MRLEELRQQFIVDEAALSANLEELVSRMLPFCVVDTSGRVHLKKSKLAAKAKVKLILAAKGLAHELDRSFNAEATIDEIANDTGLPANQIRARLNELVDERFAQSAARGTYRSNLHQISGFLEEILDKKQ